VSCDVCEINELFALPGQYQVCRNCGCEYGWPEVDASDLRDAVDRFELLRIGLEDPDGYATQRAVDDAKEHLLAVLWRNRHGIRNAAILAERAQEEQEQQEQRAMLEALK
jgi:hypothetical protein